MDTFNYIHTIILITSFFAIIVSIVSIVYDNDSWKYVIGPLTFFVNAFLYTVFLHIKYVCHVDIVSYEFIVYWSGVVRLHSMFLLLSYAVIPLIKKRK